MIIIIIGEKRSTSEEFVDAVTQHNIHHSMDEILTRSSVLKELYDDGKIGIVAAYHDIDTGKVEFLFEDMPKDCECGKLACEHV